MPAGLPIRFGADTGHRTGVIGKERRMSSEPMLSASPRGRRSLDTDVYVSEREPTRWVAWLVFAGIMLMLLGAFQATLGLVALFSDGFFVAHRGGQVVLTDYTTWGIIHLILAAIAFLTGAGLLFGLTAARVAAVVLCVLNIIICFLFLGAYPWWAVMLIAFSAITTYAIIVHGGEVEDAYDR
jgi:hypothetical protein